MPYFAGLRDVNNEFQARVDAYVDLMSTHPDLKNSFDLNLHEVMLEELVAYEMGVRYANQSLAHDPRDKEMIAYRADCRNGMNRLRADLNLTPDKLAKLKRGHNQQKPKTSEDKFGARVETYEGLTGYNIDADKYV